MKKFDVMTFVDNHYYDDSDVVVGCCIEHLTFKSTCNPEKEQDWYCWRTSENGVCVFTSEGSVLDSLEKNVLLSKYI